MSLLPLISHRLFAQAVYGEPGAERRPAASKDSEPAARNRDLMPLPLELLEAASPLPHPATRRLRSSAAGGQI